MFRCSAKWNNALKAKSDRTLSDEFFHDLLDEHFSEDESRRQLETAIQWGRYAEIFDYDAATGQADAHRGLTPVPELLLRIDTATPAPTYGAATRRFALDLGVSDRHRRFSFCVRGDLRRLRDRPVVARSGGAARAHFAKPARSSAVRVVLPRPHQRRVRAEPGLRAGVRLHRGEFAPRGNGAGSAARHFAIDSGAEFLARRDARDGGDFSAQPVRRRTRLDLADLHRTSLEYRVQFLFFAENAAARAEGSRASSIASATGSDSSQLDLPFSTIGLVWNSMMSVAGGWFFLMACEMFVLGDRDFRLPGLGSFLQTAASNGDTRAILWGLAAMIAVIVLLDQLVWRPVIVWADKFKFEQVESASRHANTLLRLIGRASFVIRVYRLAVHPVADWLTLTFAIGARRAAATFSAPKRITRAAAARSFWRRDSRGTGICRISRGARTIRSSP